MQLIALLARANLNDRIINRDYLSTKKTLPLYSAPRLLRISALSAFSGPTPDRREGIDINTINTIIILKPL